MALRGLYYSFQSNSSSCERYFETLTNLREIISHCGGFIENHPFLIDKFIRENNSVDPDYPTDNKTKAAKNATEEAYICPRNSYQVSTEAVAA